MTGERFGFGPFVLDTKTRRLYRDGIPVALPTGGFEVLHLLVINAGEVVPIEEFAAAIRDAEAAPPAEEPRRPVEADLDAMLEPYKAFADAQSRNLSFSLAKIAEGRRRVEAALMTVPDLDELHEALAWACWLRFESTRTDTPPDTAELHRAVTHGRLAMEHDYFHWTGQDVLGLALHGLGQREEALRHLREATADRLSSWISRLALTYATWGSDRMAAAEATFNAVGHQPVAMGLKAAVLVARGDLVEAERWIDTALQHMYPNAWPRVALDWFKGLLCHARGADDQARAWLQAEAALEGDNVYRREFRAHAWCAIGAIEFDRDKDVARAAFEDALALVPGHALARAGLAILDGPGSDAARSLAVDPSPAFELVIARAALLVHAGDVDAAVAMVRAALEAAAPGNTGWLIPLDPLLRVWDARAAWAPVLELLHLRAR